MQSEQKKEILFAGLSAGPSQYQACVLQARGNKMTVLKSYSVSKEETIWSTFVKRLRQDFPEHSFVTTMGFDDSCVGFYRFEVPVVNEKQLQAVIAGQAEVHLPLPIEQMQYDWQILTQHQQKATVAVAAVKRDMVPGVVNDARQANVDAIVLNSEAVLRAIRSLGNDLSEDFALLRICQNNTKLFFVQNGMLAKATKFDCEFSAMTEEQMSQAHLFCLDVQNVMAEYLLNHDKPFNLYLDGPDSLVETVEGLLNDKGIETSRVRYDLNRIEGVEDFESNMECLGLALVAHDASRQYDLFDGLYNKANSEHKEATGGKKKVLIAAVCSMLVIFIAACYGADKLRLAAYEKQMNTPEFSQTLETHRLRGFVAQQRIDVPDLIEKINQSIPEGVTVHSLVVRRFQRISIGAACKEPKMMYGFAEALGKCKGVEAARLSNQGFDDKKKQTTFTLTFDYKNFTDKRKKVQ